VTESKTTAWVGASGASYTYYVYTLPHSFKEGQDGNYIYAKLEDKKWKPVYIGEGDLGERVSDEHHQASCIKSKGATHIHAHLNTDEAARKAEEADLLKAHPEAYKPTGCNVKTGG
jgi:hypothetical protein